VSDEPGRVVEERHQIALAQTTADRHAWAVHHVAVPELTGAGGDEAAFLLGQARRAGEPRQTVLLEQAVDTRARQGAAGDAAGDLEQALDLADRAAGILALGGENSRLDRGGEFRLAAIGTHLRDQSVESASAVAVVPPLDRLLAEQAPVGAGDDVLASSQLTQALLQFAPRQPLAG
jgi:hypothetical protein